MHVIFGNVSYWQIFILRILKYFKFEVFYLYIDAKSDVKKNEIATKLKENNIFPLPIEFQKKISPKASFSLCSIDPDEIAYKKNIELIPDTILKKYCNLFSIHEKKIKKLRLLIQDFIFYKQMSISGKLGIWSALYPKKKLIYVSFKFTCFYNSNTGQNIYKIIIPLNILNYLKKIIKKIFLILFTIFANKNIKEQKNGILNEQNLDELSKKTVAFIPHKGLVFGSKAFNIFEKSLYYSDNVNSYLNKYNILHLDYSNYPKPEENICWVCLNKIRLSNIKFFFKVLKATIKTFYLIRSWQTFLGWILCIHQYYVYEKYCEVIEKFSNLKMAIIDYVPLCPKTLILALEKNNIKTVATQERFIHTFFTSFANVILDTYYVASEYAANVIKSSKYHDIKNVIPIGQYRSDYIALYKKENIPEEIFKAKENGKKVIVFFGHDSPNDWFDSYSETITCWSAQVNFLEDVIKFSQNINDIFIILRYKTLDWRNNVYFKNILEKINNCENIVISNYYKEPFYSYRLCVNADLIVAKHTSIADECLSNEIPVLFYEYTHNMKRIASDAFDYSPSGLMCYNFEELLEKSKSLLFDSSSKLKGEITELNKTIYHVSGKGNIKNKIVNQLENFINENKFY